MLRSLVDRLAGRRPFPGSAPYWEQSYRKGGNSGAGSYGRLARFKADYLNGFIAQRRFQSILEFGCSDGAQLQLSAYPSYVGVDVSGRCWRRRGSGCATGPTTASSMTAILAG